MEVESDIPPAGGSDQGGEKIFAYSGSAESYEVDTVVSKDHLHRQLGGRQIQMIAIGGSIGTALFVSIGSGLTSGGPGSLLIAFALYCIFLATVNNCMAEMSVYMPVSGGWIRMVIRWKTIAFEKRELTIAGQSLGR